MIKQGRLSRFFANPLCILLGALSVCLLPFIAQANPNPPNAGPMSNNICISSSAYSGTSDPTTVGTNIITAIFNAINAVMQEIAQTFYTSILSNSSFQAVWSAVVVLYVAIYGAMIMFNLAPVSTRDIVVRLIKIGIVYGLLSTSNGWTFFDTYIGNFFVGGMNELIADFAQAGVNGSTPVTLSGTCSGGTSGAAVSITQMQLCPSAMQSFFVPVGQVFATKFVVAIMSLATMCNWGLVMAIALVIGLIEFIFMLIGAIGTYIKSIVGLCFLFGIAPIFVAAFLFDKTKQIFLGWINQVVSFALTPVMLFAFLSFYIQLIASDVNTMLYAGGATPSLDFCWGYWFSIGIFDLNWWRPSVSGTTYIGECKDTFTPPVSILDVLYFVVLCFLGKTFSTHIEQIAKDLSGGTGPGAINLRSPTQSVLNKLFGGSNKNSPPPPSNNPPSTWQRMNPLNWL